jgi:cytochrome c peroxidase
VPLGLPALSVAPTGTSAAVVQLGEQLFVDPRLSVDGKISCGTCHLRERQFTDGLVTARGLHGRILTRNTPSLINVAYATSLFWDGRARNLGEQTLMPLLNASEHGLADAQTVVSIVRRDPAYVEALERAMQVDSSTLSIEYITAALVAFERTLLAGNSAFDRYQYGGDAKALSDAAIRGLTLFRGRGQCASCHPIGATSALFTDQGFHMSPRGLPASATQRLGELTRMVVELKARPTAPDLGDLIATDSDVAALGRFVVTLDPKDIGLFKTPSLRNVALTGPYMHDGSVATLPEAIELELYSRSAQRYPLVMTADEKADIRAFLESLTSPPADIIPGPLH